MCFENLYFLGRKRLLVQLKLTTSHDVCLGSSSDLALGPVEFVHKLAWPGGKMKMLHEVLSSSSMILPNLELSQHANSQLIPSQAKPNSKVMNLWSICSQLKWELACWPGLDLAQISILPPK